MKCVVVGGAIPQDVIDTISSCDARGWKAFNTQVIICKLLENIGYTTEMEYPVKYERDEGCPIMGKLDIMAVQKHGDEVIAIEVDRRSPRIKSVQKLEALKHCTCKMIVLREPYYG